MIDDEKIERLLAAHAVPPPASDVTERTLAAAAPLLAVHARRATVRSALRPLLAALLPLPLIVGVDILVVQTLHAALAALLPAALSTFVVAHYALLLVVLVAATYAAVPLLVDRQLRAGLETSP